MRELWNGSHDLDDLETGQPLLWIWWVLWVGRGVANGVLRLMRIDGSQIGEIGALALVATELAVDGVAIALLVAITRAQSRPRAVDQAEVFA